MSPIFRLSYGTDLERRKSEGRTEAERRMKEGHILEGWGRTCNVDVRAFITPILQSIHYKYREKSYINVFYHENNCGIIRKIYNFESDIRSH